MKTSDIMNMDIRYLGDMHKISLEPGDTLVLQCEHVLSEEDHRVMRDYMEAVMPGHKCIVIGKGMKLGIVST